ncbi:hypothetical protein BH10ACI2_BH10ACI2_16120 [soil metagenome]
MRTKLFAMAAITVMIVSVAGFAVYDATTARAKKREAARIVGILPASDGVAVFESKRFLDEAIPKVLSANQPMLGQISAKIVEMNDRTGIDLRKFDQVAVGVTMKQLSATNFDTDVVAIASGDINAGALVAVAKLASKGTYREEKIGSKTVYVFTAKDVLKKTTAPAVNSKITGLVDQALDHVTKDIAVVSLDPNTLVIGSLDRVRETVQGSSHVGVDVSSLLSVKETSVVSFAVKTPSGLDNLLPLDNDELGKNIDSIHYVAGSLDVAANGTSVQVMARTGNAEQAQQLKETIDGLQLVGKAILGGSKRADQKVYGRMLKNAVVTVRGSDLSLDLTVPQSDIDVLIGGIK